MSATTPDVDEAGYRGEPNWVPEELVVRGVHLLDEALELLPTVVRLAAECEDFEHDFDAAITRAEELGPELAMDGHDEMFHDWANWAGIPFLRQVVRQMGMAIDYHVGETPSDPKHQPQAWDVMPAAQRWRAKAARRLVPDGPLIEGRLYRQPDPWSTP